MAMRRLSSQSITKKGRTDEAMHDAGQFYLSKADAVRKCARLDNSNVKIHALNRSRVVDIDTFEDFHLAEERLNIYRVSEDLHWAGVFPHECDCTGYIMRRRGFEVMATVAEKPAETICSAYWQ